MQVKVDPDKCQGHTLCAMAAPGVFELDDIDGHATAIEGDVPLDLEADVKEAVHSCPERAVFVLEGRS